MQSLIEAPEACVSVWILSELEENSLLPGQVPIYQTFIIIIIFLRPQQWKKEKYIIVSDYLQIQ